MGSGDFYRLQNIFETESNKWKWNLKTENNSWHNDNNIINHQQFQSIYIYTVNISGRIEV